MSIFKGNQHSHGNNYQDKSQRIIAWSDFIRSAGRILWLIVAIFALAALGKHFFSNTENHSHEHTPIEKVQSPKVDWNVIDAEVAEKLKASRAETEVYASQQLDQWVKENMERVDNDFLEWYFSFWTQQKINLLGLWAQGKKWIFSDSPAAARAITLEVQEEFSDRVIRPENAQLELERIIGEVVSFYTGTLKGKLETIPFKYSINPADWNRYLSNMSGMARKGQAKSSIPITLKAVIGYSASTTAKIFTALKPVITKIMGKISLECQSQRVPK
ncbi:MAG: hypothetical protein GY757_01020 [bacterium]|nr:hypothetical protein [bacterium]